MSNNPVAEALDRVRLLAAAGHLAELGDGDLLDRCATAADAAAFAALVERHGAMVHAVCSRIVRDPHDADDACQATFLVLLRRAAGIRKRPSVASWLHGVARRVSLALVRQRIDRQRRERQVPPRPTPADDPPWSEVRAALDEELDRLPERLRGPVVLCYLEGKTRDEAAAALGLSPGRLHGLLQRARARLHERLVRRGVNLGSGLLVAGLDGGVWPALPPTLAIRVINGAVAVMAGQELAPALATAQTLSLTNEVLNAMFYAKLLTTSAWAGACVVALCAAIGGALAQPGANPARPPVAVVPAPEQKEDAAEFRAVMAAPAATKDDFKFAVLAVSNDQKALLSRNYIVTGGNPNVSSSGLHLWSLAGEKSKRTSLGDSVTIGFVPKSTLAYSVNWGDGVVLWDTRTHAKAAGPFPHAFREDTMPRPAFSPDGEVMATRSELDHLRFWNVKTREPITDSIPQKGIVETMEFSPDGKWLFSWSWSREFKVWSAKTGKLAAGPFRHDAHGAASAYSPKGQKIVTAENGSTKVAEWKSEAVIRSANDWSVLHRVKLPGLIREVAWIDDAHVLVVGDERNPPPAPGETVSVGRNVLRVVKLAGEKPEIQTVVRDAPWISFVRVAPNGKHFLAGVNVQGTSCWKTGEEKPLWTKPGSHVGYLGDGDWALLTPAQGAGASVVSLRDGKELWRKDDAVAARAEGANVWIFGEKGVEVLRGPAAADRP